MAQQYIDYAREFSARQERAQQLTAKYDQTPTPKLTRNIWMHSIDRYEKPQELKWLAITMIAISIVFIIVLFYYS